MNSLKKAKFIIEVASKESTTHSPTFVHNCKSITEYFFQTKSKNIKFFSNAPFKLIDDHIRVLIIGQIFEKNASKYVCDLYKTDQLLNADILGHYLIIIFDEIKQKLMLISDLTNSYKCFVYSNKHRTVYTNDFMYLLNFSKNIDSLGLYSYLVMGFNINERTILEAVKIFPPASVLIVDEHENGISNYWDFNFICQNYALSDAIEQFNELITNNIKKYAATNRNFYISLSGGYDISTILALICENVSIDRIKPFTYYYKNIYKDSDAYVAKLQVEKLRLGLLEVPVFENDLLEFINQNYLLGKTVANVCEDVLVWKKLNRLKEVDKLKDVFVFGEEVFGQKKYYGLNEINILNILGFSFPRIRDINPLIDLSEAFYITQEMIEDYENEILIYVRNKFLEFPTRSKTLDFLYYRFRIANIMTSWREEFAGNYFQVINPFLSKEILEFVLTLPDEFRNDKLFLKKFAKIKFPNLFKIKRAKRRNNVSDWSEILYENISFIDASMKKNGLIFQIKNYCSKMEPWIIKNLKRIPYSKFLNRNLNRVDFIKRLLIFGKIYEK